ncbi:MAG: MFS transporter [Magnetococcales bacterium]|nr:MFS transporter [Magnetococcales bacterium]
MPYELYTQKKSSGESPFRNLVYLKLFSAQVIALTGTGLSTIALALLAYDLAEGNAGEVLGIALALKMVAYVLIAPAVGGMAHLLPRKSLMITMDVVRAVLVLLLPFVDAVWQIYTLIFLINACAAAFKPIYQAIIPDVLPYQKDYTKALSMFRIAYDMENILSPTLAALLLTFWTFDGLFTLNSVAFLISALLIFITQVPVAATSERSSAVLPNLLFGISSYLKTPRLRGLLALYVGVAAASSMVIVNTVVYVRSQLGGSDVETAQAMLAVGVGSVAAALLLPRLLVNHSDRKVMIAGGWLLCISLAFGMTEPGFMGLLGLWFLIGLGLSMAQTPSGRLITASCRPGDRTAFFSANFSLSHGCWFIGYLLAGFMGSVFGLTTTFAILACLVFLATVTAQRIWPLETNEEHEHLHDPIEHEHAHVHDEHHQHEHAPGDELAVDDPLHVHQHDHPTIRHKHQFVIDIHHLKWPD